MGCGTRLRDVNSGEAVSGKVKQLALTALNTRNPSWRRTGAPCHPHPHPLTVMYPRFTSVSPAHGPATVRVTE